MTSNGRILKSNQLDNHEIVLLSKQGSHDPTGVRVGPPSPADPVEEALLFTASEVEDLCEKARASGAADAVLALEPALADVATALGAFAHEREVALGQAQQGAVESVIDTAMSVARWVLGRELSEPSALLELVARALNEPLSARVCKLRVHPDLVAMLYEIAPDRVELLADQSLELGEFRVEHDGPEVALRFDTTLGRATEALMAGSIETIRSQEEAP